MTAEAIAEPAGAYPPLRRNRDFILLWTGQLVSTVGTRVTSVAFPLLVLALTRTAGLMLAALLAAVLLFAVLRGHVDAITGMAAGMAAVVLLSPIVHPWYLLWAVVTLAATRGLPTHRRFALATSAVLAVMVPPTGADFAFRAFQLPLGILAGVAILLVALYAVRRQLAREQDPASAPLPGTAVDTPPEPVVAVAADAPGATGTGSPPH